MFPIVPLPQLKQKRKNSKTNNSQIISSSSDIDKSKNYIFKINLSSKNKNNNINKRDTNKNTNKIIKIEKTEKIENNNISFIDNAIINFGKGLYNLSLKDALKSIELEEFSENANYIAFLCYLEMYDIDSAEKFLVNQNKNKKLKNLLENKKIQILKN